MGASHRGSRLTAHRFLTPQSLGNPRGGPVAAAPRANIGTSYESKGKGQKGDLRRPAGKRFGIAASWESCAAEERGHLMLRR
mmetsp:Transcript_23376/g.54351  ORF Transcript_23376/g.54351 Transcript_23376/m.54351 type:complete len:82 (-) Transcript_23376:469-714(-)